MAEGRHGIGHVILVSGGVRETLFAQPLVRALPSATVFAPAAGLPTLLGMDGLDRAFPLGDDVRGWLWAWRWLRSRSVLVAMLPPPAGVGRATLAYLAGIPRRLMVRGPFDWCATRRLTLPLGTHPVEAGRALVGLLDPGVPTTETGPVIRPSGEARSRLEWRLAAAGLMLGQPSLVLIAGGGNWPRSMTRRPAPTRPGFWPAERFAVMANQLGVGHALLIRGAGDDEIVRETAASIHFPSIVLDLREISPEEVAAAAQRSVGVIGHDGDALHVAAAAGGQVVSLLTRAGVSPYGPARREIRVDDLSTLTARAVVEMAQAHLSVSAYA